MDEQPPATPPPAPAKKRKKRKKTGGRQAGTPNKTTTAIKRAVMSAFDGIGGVEAFTRWASRNRGVFYTKIAVRLIPTEVGLSGRVRVDDKRGVLKQIPDAVLAAIITEPPADGESVH